MHKQLIYNGIQSIIEPVSYPAGIMQGSLRRASKLASGQLKRSIASHSIEGFNRSMKFRVLVILLSSLNLLSGCATEAGPKPHRWAKAVQTADSRDAHLRLEEHYEAITTTLLADAEEEREMLQQYLAYPWKYGKRIQDLKSQANAMVRDLEKAAQESKQLAEYHRQMALEQTQ